MTVKEVKADLQARFFTLPHKSLSRVMPRYGIVQVKTEALTIPKLETMFTEKDFGLMCDSPAFLDFALYAVWKYSNEYYWDGYVIDARTAYTCGTHDFEGTRKLFSQFWLETKRNTLAFLEAY